MGAEVCHLILGPIFKEERMEIEREEQNHFRKRKRGWKMMMGERDFSWKHIHIKRKTNCDT